MSFCSLCLNKTLKKNSINVEKKQECGSTVEDIIKEHFWFFSTISAFSSSQRSSIICKLCWNKLETFHEFFIAVKHYHKIDEKPEEIEINTADEHNEILIKVEEIIEDDYDDHFSVLRGSGSSDDDKEASKIRKNEEFQSKKRKFDQNQSKNHNLDQSDTKKQKLETNRRRYDKPEPEREKLNQAESEFEESEPEEQNLDHKGLKRQTFEYKKQEFDRIESREHKIDQKESEKLRFDKSKPKRPTLDQSESIFDQKEHKRLKFDNLESKGRKMNQKESENEKFDKLELKKYKFDVSNEELDILRVHTELKCEKCSKIFIDWQDIRSHYRKDHKVIGFVRCCGRKIDRSAEVKDHAQWHLNPHIFQCHICGKSAISRENLKLHEEIHIPESDRAFSCDKCDKRFVNRYNLNMHVKVHDKDDKVASIPCNFCDKLFKTDRQLKSHVDFCHKNADQSWICHICSKVLKNRYTLDIHVKAHTDPDEPVECGICHHVLANKRRFAIHMAKHKSEEGGPYECEKGCGKIFKHRPAMLDHIAFVHTKNRFNCSCCGKEFKHKKALEEHEVTQHKGLDLYSCPFCERTFKNGSNMHSHKKKAHPEEYRNLPAPSYMKGGTLGDYCE